MICTTSASRVALIFTATCFLLVRTSTGFLIPVEYDISRRYLRRRRSGPHSVNISSAKEDIRITAKSDNDQLQTSSSYEFHVAPMQCYTNASLRYLYRLLSPDAKLWTEMEKISDLTCLGALERRFGPLSRGHGGPANNNDITLQLGGNDVTKMEECVNQLYDLGYQFNEINLNCGCPSIESGGSANYGASLMKQPELTKSLLEAISRGCNKNNGNLQTELSLKCRIAVFETPDDMIHPISDTDYAQLHHYVTQAEQAGISHIVLHARPAILSGLNPVKNRQVPVLDYSIVESIANDFPSLRVTLNGGIQSFSQLEGLRGETNSHSSEPITSFMAGRWMLQRPLDIIQVQNNFLSPIESSSPSINQARRAIEQYFDYIERNMFPQSKNRLIKTPLDELCLPLYLLSEQLREDYDNCEGNVLLSEMDIEMLYETMKEGIEQIEDSLPNKKKKKAASGNVNFKKLSASFKDIVGRKVVNKWKRNRAEL